MMHFINYSEEVLGQTSKKNRTRRRKFKNLKNL